MNDSNKRICSVEFFPPATDEGAEKLRATRRQLRQLNPAFFSVTYGAGGTTRDRTLETDRRGRGGPHLPGGGAGSEEPVVDTADLQLRRTELRTIDGGGHDPSSFIQW